MPDEIYKIIIQTDFSQLKDLENEYKRLKESVAETLKVINQLDNVKRASIPQVPDYISQFRDSVSQMKDLQFPGDTLASLKNTFTPSTELRAGGNSNTTMLDFPKQSLSHHPMPEIAGQSAIALAMINIQKQFKTDTSESFKNMIASSKMIEASFKKDVGIVSDIMKVFTSIGSGDTGGIFGSFASLIGSFIPGASEILSGIGGIIHALGGMPSHNAPTGSFNPIVASHSMNSLKQMPSINNYMLSKNNQTPIELHVHVNSEIEKTKAVKFLINNMPDYNIHLQQKRI